MPAPTGGDRLLRTVVVAENLPRSVLTVSSGASTLTLMTARRSLLLLLALVAASLFTFASPANAAENPDYTAPPPSEEPVVVPNAIRRSPAAPVIASRQKLAITGSDVTSFAVIGAVLVAGGAGLLVVRRRVAI